MTGSGAPGGRIARDLVGEPLAIGPYTVQPVARLSGRYGGGGDVRGSGFGGVFRVTPTKVVVRSQDGREEEVEIKDPTSEAVRGIVAATAAIAVVCLALMFVAKAIGITRRKRHA